MIKLKKLLCAIKYVIVIAARPFSLIQSGWDMWGVVQIIALGITGTIQTFQNMLAGYWQYIIIALLLIAAIKIQMQYKHKQEVHQVLVSLAKLRKDGVELRNQLLKTIDDNEIEKIHNQLKNWKTSVEGKIAEISSVDADLWCVLDSPAPMVFYGTIQGVDVDTVSHYSNFLVRLKQIIDKWENKNNEIMR